MYSTCLYCHKSLGSNEAIERFPIGRRLAFDPARGRLWVVCSHCERWNLSPIEERWEAVEESEKMFRSSTLRVATDNIGLARTREGLDLIRIGEPHRPEFAGWRYGRELVRRQRKDLLGAATVIGGAGGVVIATAATGFLITPFLVPAIPIAAVAAVIGGDRILARRTVARVTGDNGQLHVVRAKHLKDVDLGTDGSEAGLVLVTGSDQGRVVAAGEDAVRLGAVLCARRNQVGGTAKQVGSAVDFLEQAGGPERVLAHIGGRGAFNKLWYTERLALEIALHESSERAALEGELAALEAAWKEAEEIAAISDGLLLDLPRGR